MMYTQEEMFDLEEFISEKEQIVENTFDTENIEENKKPIKSKYF